jgi:hypothetical protein
VLKCRPVVCPHLFSYLSFASIRRSISKNEPPSTWVWSRYVQGSIFSNIDEAELPVFPFSIPVQLAH